CCHFHCICAWWTICLHLTILASPLLSLSCPLSTPPRFQGAALGGKFSIPRAVYGEKIKQAETVQELHTAVGCDFFINSQCLSEAIPG
ncbi:unnamed protein product, partial [Closterium sp. NIES-53]